MNLKLYVSYTKKDGMLDYRSPVLIFLELYIYIYMYNFIYKHMYIVVKIYVFFFKEELKRNLRLPRNILKKQQGK